MSSGNKMKREFLLCIENSEHQASLELLKVYLRLPDAIAETRGLVRVVDESGEDYLYPSRFFAAITVPEVVEKALAGAL